MARTQIATGHALAPVIVQRQLFLEQKKAAYFSKFFSASGDMPVFEKSDFTKEKGDTMTFGIIPRITGAPITGNATVVGRIVADTKGPKINAFTYKPKANQRKRWGHRQKLATLEITSIKKG